MNVDVLNFLALDETDNRFPFVLRNTSIKPVKTA